MSWLNRSLFTLLLALVSLSTATAQGPPVVEYGSINELRGVTKIFVDTGLDAQQREQIIKEIRKKLPNLIIVSRPEDSDVHLRFTIEDPRATGTIVYPPYPGTPPVVVPGGRSRIGEGVGAVVRLMPNNRIRVLMSFRDVRGTVFEREPSTNFARKFVKAYEKANA